MQVCNLLPQYTSAAVVVIDFVSNWLLARLAKGVAKKVGASLKGLAVKIGKKIKKIKEKIVSGVKKIGGKIKRGWAKAKRYLARTKIGKLIGRGIKAVKRKIDKLKEKFKKWREKEKGKIRRRRKKGFKGQNKNCQERFVTS